MRVYARSRCWEWGVFGGQEEKKRSEADQMMLRLRAGEADLWPPVNCVGLHVEFGKAGGRELALDRGPLGWISG